MRTLLASAVGSLLACVVGCGSTPPLDPSTSSMPQTNQPTTMQSSGATGATDAAGAAGSTVTMSPTGAGGAFATGGITQPDGASVCDRPTGDRLFASSLAELQQTLRGTWQLCSNVGLFDQPQAGMFVGPDDRYVFLELVGGKLVPKTGLQNKGHLEYDYGISQVNFVSDMGITIIAAPPIISNDPRQLIINNEGVEIYTYAAVRPTTTQGSGTVGVTAAGGTTGAGGAAGATGTSGIAQPSGTSACDRPTGDRLLPSSLAELQQILRGTWQLCSNVGLFDQPQAGILIGPDDHYVLLELVGGKLVPKTGLQNKGHLEWLDTSQVDLVSDMGGFIPVHPVLSDDPRQLIIDNEGVETYTYGRVP